MTTECAGEIFESIDIYDTDRNVKRIKVIWIRNMVVLQFPQQTYMLIRGRFRWRNILPDADGLSPLSRARISPTAIQSASLSLCAGLYVFSYSRALLVSFTSVDI